MFWALCFCAILAFSGALNIPGVPKDLNQSDEVLSDLADHIANIFTKEYTALRKTGIESPALRQISKQLAEMHSKKDIFTKQMSELSPADNFFLCTTCRATANVILHMIRDENGEFNGPKGDENIRLLTLEFCRRFDVVTQEVCLGLYENNWPTVKYIAQESVMDSRTFCSLFMEVNICKISKNSTYNFTLNLDTNGPAITGPKDEVPKSGVDNVAVLHISDLHYDPLYEPGSLAECKEPLCCQRQKNVFEGTSKAAGYWGDYRNCDAPWHMIENALEHINETHQHIDYIYLTGDVVDHMVWATSREKHIEVISKVNNKLAEMFPGVPVYSCIGNHEPHPINAFSPEDAPEEINTKWLYEHLYRIWSKWLPFSTKDTILKGGYYTDSPKAGFRIIVLNNNDCYNMNWWLFYNGENKRSQLQWLHDTLLAAEKSQEYVHILMHLPTGEGSCWSVWSREFDKTIVRFSNTISGIFNGHSHKDEMAVHYSSDGHAVGVVWNGGSISPSTYKNPNYRFYHVDSSTMQVAESKTWIFNLTHANIYGATQLPVWYEMYDFRTEFTPDMSPYGIDKLLDEFAEDPNMLRKYWEYQSTKADTRLSWGCNRECLMNTICRIATTVNDQQKRCQDLQAKLSKSLDDEDATSTTNSPLSTEGTPKPEDNGAISMATMSLSFIMTLYIALKYIL